MYGWDEQKENVRQHLVRKILRMWLLKKKTKSGDFLVENEKEKGAKNVDGELRQHFDQKIEEGDDEIKCKWCKIYWWWREKK